MQTRPGSADESGEPEGDRTEPELDETVSLESLADEGSDEDSAEAGDEGDEGDEPEAQGPAEADDAEAEGPGAERSEAEHAEEEKTGPEPESGETVDLADLPDTPDEAEKPGIEKPGAEKSGVEKSGAEKSGPELGETVNLGGLLPDDAVEATGPDEAAGERAEGEKRRAPESAETVDLAGLVPDKAAGEKPGARDLAETVDLRSLLPEDLADKPSGADEPEPPLRRRSPADAGGEPPRRRPMPGGQPPRRPGPGQDPRRGPGQPHSAHASAEPGPRRRPPSDHAPDHAAKRHPGPEARSAGASGGAGAGAAAAGAAAASGPTAAKPGAPKPPSVSLGRRRLIAAFWPPRLSRNQAVVGVLLAALGAAVAIQVHATNTSDEILRGARADDLVNILDEVTSRGQSLDAELRNLETQNATIQDSTDKAQAALTQAQQKAKDLQILAGTVKAKGSGITMTITDPQGQMKSATLLNALEELRAAGAEVIQVNDVRVVVSSSFVDTADGGIALDGHELTQPYVYKVIGDPNTLGPAMQIPGGVVANVKSTQGANATIASGQVLIDAVVPQPDPQYAKAN
ncbi:DUF881 domain-containing protein [Catenulispora pinisilvae]|uniref:DUF881 domain-containing protein n=1 Tax=Catenulispora pinisilvae TaxID=2705253 RepID=UPI001890EDF6|nr:DUF881 domain-containing protein [Catenulispora pinisilvae]